MNPLLLTSVIGSSAFTAVVTWVLSQSKLKAETEKVRVSTISDVIKIYKDALDDMKKQVNDLKDRVRFLEGRLNLESTH